MQGEGEKEPNASEFISALVAGTNARLLVQACGAAADATTLALVAAAYQTNGKVICILGSTKELQKSKQFLNGREMYVEFVIGDAADLIRSEYRGADCVVVDCRLKDCDGILEGAKSFVKGLVLGYNAYSMGTSWCSGVDLHLVPIGAGVLVSGMMRPGKKTSRWVVQVDKYTGEEHVFRVGRRNLHRKDRKGVLQA